MRLNSIRLAGFKSFVEPTQFQLPGQLVGVVGPNGCGKSNVIDAVRWVLGESKASELRGESMQDVIFNGSSLRKPAGRASVELTFDNSDGRAGGPWSRFAEIAVKRVLTRDGTSSYTSTASRCAAATCRTCSSAPASGRAPTPSSARARSRGSSRASPRSSALSRGGGRRLEVQGAAPRDRGRLKDTRENLTRVEDILRELNQNLEKLETQAEVAGRYRGLQQDGAAEAAPALVPAPPRRAREEARCARPRDRGRARARMRRGRRLRQAEAELGRASASRTTPPTMRCMPPRVRSARPHWK
jgi:chromosome segregation protein